MTDRRFYGGQITRYETQRQVPPTLASSSGLSEDAGGPNYRFGGLITYEKPIKEFFADITIGANANQVFRNNGQNDGTGLPSNCVGLRFINLVGNVMIALNGGGARTVLNNDVFSGCEIQILQVITDAAGGCIIQAVGTGD